jgi:hypothetical protein
VVAEKTEDGMADTNWRKLARDLGRAANAELFRLGDVLHIIHANRLYYDWGHTNWGIYVEGEVGIPEGTAYRLMKIARWMGREGFSKADRGRIAALGQCKAEVLVRLVDKDNLETWLEWARVHSVAELRVQAREHGKPVFGTKAFWINRTHRRFIERAVREAMRTGAKTQGEALSMICEGYVVTAKRAAS